MSEKNIVKLNGHEDPELESLYQQAQKILPPAELDDTIKSAARDDKTSATVQKHRWFASIAATVIIGVLFLQLYPVSLTEQATDLLSEQRWASTYPEDHDAKQAGQSGMPAREATAPAKRQYATSPAVEKPAIAADTGRLAATGLEDLARDRSMTDNLGKLSSTHIETEMSADYAAAEMKSHSKQDNEPEQMLKRIQQYIDEGEIEKAREELKKLKQSYPEFEIRAEITEKLE